MRDPPYNNLFRRKESLFHEEEVTGKELYAMVLLRKFAFIISSGPILQEKGSTDREPRPYQRAEF
jgi:hypothetical protein